MKRRYIVKQVYLNSFTYLNDLDGVVENGIKGNSEHLYAGNITRKALNGFFFREMILAKEMYVGTLLMLVKTLSVRSYLPT